MFTIKEAMDEAEKKGKREEPEPKKGKLKLHLKKGALHREMGIKQGKKIPVAKLEAEKAKGGLAAKRAQFAINARKWSHK